MKYAINKSLLPYLEQKFNSFKKKFDKYGEGTLVMSSVDEYFHEKTKERIVVVEIEGNYQIKNYKFVAKLEVAGEENLVKKISSDEEVPAIYRTRCYCDHCKTERDRKTTILLKNTDNGEFIQVGKSCVKDYLGVDIVDYARYLSLWESLDEWVESNETLGGVNFKREFGYDVDEVLGETVEYVSKYGYISKQASFDYDVQSTSSCVFNAINKTTNIYGKLLNEYTEISDNTKEKVAEIKDFINNYDNTNNDYAHNLKVLLSSSVVGNENFGLVVSAVGFFLRETNKKETAEKERNSNWFAKVGDRIEFTSTPVCVTSYDTEYGTTWVYKMMKGNDVIIWKTNKFLENVEVTIKATVKENSEYRGTRQTVITRGKVIE